MFDQVLPGNTKKYLALLAKKNILPAETYLSGGTAAALQLGHRISYDLDFFTSKKFEIERVLEELKNTNEFKLDRIDWQTILGNFPGCKFSIFYYQYSLIEKPLDYLGIKIASLKDLVASKIGAIATRGKKRDFTDLYYILKDGKSGNINDFLLYYDQRFQNLASQRYHIIKSLDYFADADKDEDPKMLVDNYSWEEVKKVLQEEVRKLI